MTFMVGMGSALITTMYIYGIIKNRGNYLLPYFCLKVFNVVITFLTTLGFYSCLPNIKLWIKMHSDFPYKEELLAMDKQTLDLLLFSTLVAVTLLKVSLRLFKYAV
jgi:lysosomal-associated transmembrane protein